MDKQGIYLQLYKRAPAPNRDYYGLTITKHEVILNIWNITHGPHVFPKKQKCPLEDFSEDRMLKADIERLFGKHVVQYCIMLSRGDRKLECMPTKIFLYILRHLATNDILNLGQTSKIFFELCSRESTWKLLFKKRHKKRITTDDIDQSEIRGWRNALLTKILLQDTPKSQNKPKAKNSPKVKAAQIIKDIYKSHIINKDETFKNGRNQQLTDKPLKSINPDNKKFVNIVPDNKKISLKQKSCTENYKVENKSKPMNQETQSRNPFEIPNSFYQSPEFGKSGKPLKPLKPFTFSNKKPQSAVNLNNTKIINECKEIANNKLNFEKAKSNVSIINNMSDLKDEGISGEFNLKNRLNEIREKNVNLKSGLKKSSFTKKGFSVKFK